MARLTVSTAGPAGGVDRLTALRGQLRAALQGWHRPPRLRGGLHLLKHMDGLSEETLCARYLDSPYVQLFCGEPQFQPALPLDHSSTTG